ncbi:MAG: extracellular solute-binding protein [Candidatus Borkfalkiaceae bacterium]|nr:extracellular solute-binding protein [Christensenellaceae bacterium]
MKRIIAVLLTFLTLAVAVVFTSGCGKDEANKIVYYTRGNASEMEVVNKIIDAFEKAYEDEGYKVELIVSDNYVDNLKIKFGAGEAPDVFLIRNGYIENFAKEGLILNLQSFIENEKIGPEIKFDETDLWEINDGYRYNSSTNKWGDGDLYAIIKDWSPDFAMIYNKDLIDEFNRTEGAYTLSVKQRTQERLNNVTEAKYEERGYKKLNILNKSLAEIVGYPTDDGVYPSETKPMSWAQNELMCFLLTAYSSNGGIDVYGSSLEQDGMKHLLQMVESVAGSQFSDDGKTLKDNADIVEAYEHFVNYQYGSLLSSKRYNATVVDSEIEFKNKSAAVIFDGLWSFSSYNLYGINYGLAPAPTREGTDKDGNYKNYNSCFAQAHAISSTTANPELCWTFLKFYSTYGMRISVEEGFNIPGNKKIANEDFLSVSDTKQLALNRFYISLADSTKTFHYSAAIDDSRVCSYVSTYLPRVMKGDYDAKTAIKNIVAAVNKDIADMSR